MPRDPVQIQSFRRKLEISGPDIDHDIVMEVETDEGWILVYLDKGTTQALIRELTDRSKEQ